MSIRTVRLVGCDRCPYGEFTPLSARNPVDARRAAQDNGWKRTRVPASPGIPAYFEDVCPACLAKEKP